MCDYFLWANHQVTLLNNDLLSLGITYYEYTGGAHGMYYLESYNIDLKTGNQLSLKEFADREDYKEIINEEIKKQIEEEKELYFEGDFISISDDPPFYIEDDNIVIYFSLYEIAPYSSGMPTFEIPISRMQNNY
ncbi:MAG: DUF3298 domain-containing protein [Halanaerobiales bacterium]|nr:DUF3298 domain-containing protein [Halanaerobiales bacterium]